MFDWVNIDLNSSDSDDQEDNNCDPSGNWAFDENDLPDDWMNAPDPEEVSRKKKEEEERIKKEKEDAIEADKKRKQAIRDEKNKKKLLFDYDDEANNYDADIFEVRKEQSEISDFNNAKDAFGDLIKNNNNIDKIDIGEYIPGTVEQFNAYTEAIEKKISQIFPEIDQTGKTKKEYEQLKSAQESNIMKMIEYLITALCDNYKSASLADLDIYITALYNKKIDEFKKCQGYKKKSKHHTNTFFNATRENYDFDEI